MDEDFAEVSVDFFLKYYGKVSRLKRTYLMVSQPIFYYSFGPLFTYCLAGIT